MQKVSVVMPSGSVTTYNDLTQTVIDEAPNNSRINLILPVTYTNNIDFNGKSGIKVYLLPGASYTGIVSNLGTNKIVNFEFPRKIFLAKYTQYQHQLTILTNSTGLEYTFTYIQAGQYKLTSNQSLQQRSIIFINDTRNNVAERYDSIYRNIILSNHVNNSDIFIELSYFENGVNTRIDKSSDTYIYFEILD